MPTPTTAVAFPVVVKNPDGSAIVTAVTIGGTPQGQVYSTPALNTPIPLPFQIPGSQPVTVYLPPGTWTATVTDTAGTTLGVTGGTSTLPVALTVTAGDPEVTPTAYADGILGAAFALGG